MPSKPKKFSSLADNKPVVFDHTSKQQLMLGTPGLIDGTFAFMEKAGQLRGVHFGQDPKAPHRMNRRRMLAGKDVGEVGEFLDADFGNDMVEYIDGAIDTAVVAIGGLFEAVQGDPVVAELLMREVVRSNLSKFDADGEPILDEFGKVLKGPNYSRARIKEILEFYGIDIPPVSDQPTFVAYNDEDQPQPAQQLSPAEGMKLLGKEPK